jgi:hypothetical protein
MGLHFLDICLSSMSQIFGQVTKAFNDPTVPIMLRVCAQPGVGTIHVTTQSATRHFSQPSLQPPALYICAWTVVDKDLVAATQEDIDGGVTWVTPDADADLCCLLSVCCRYETQKTGEGRAFVVTFKHTLNGVDEPSLYALADHPLQQFCPHIFASFRSNDFNPDTDSPRTSICVTEMTGKGMCAKFDAAFDRFCSSRTQPPLL